MFWTKTTLHVHTVSILQGALNYSWHKVHKCNWHLVVWVHFGRIVYGISAVSGRKLKWTNADVHGIVRSSTIFNAWNIRKEEKVFQWKLRMQDSSGKRQGKDFRIIDYSRGFRLMWSRFRWSSDKMFGMGSEEKDNCERSTFAQMDCERTSLKH